MARAPTGTRSQACGCTEHYQRQFRLRQRSRRRYKKSGERFIPASPNGKTFVLKTTHGRIDRFRPSSRTDDGGATAPSVKDIGQMTELANEQGRRICSILEDILKQISEEGSLLSGVVLENEECRHHRQELDRLYSALQTYLETD